MLRSLLPVLAFLAAAELTAQPALVVSADTLYYPAEITFDVTNAGADSLTLSFPVTYEDGTLVLYGTTGTFDPGIPAWYFEVETPDSLYDFVELPYANGEPPTISLGPSASAMFRILFFDPCPICRGRRGGGSIADTLYLRGADATGADTARVILDLSGYVSSEPSAPSVSSLRVNVYPNPVRRSLTVAVESERGSTTDVAVLVVDALGREVRRFEGVPATGQAVQLDVGSLPAGAYLLRVETGPGGSGSAPVVRPFVVVR
jgi:hypothetical protein